jgi:hypothetical protein
MTPPEHEASNWDDSDLDDVPEREVEIDDELNGAGEDEAYDDSEDDD